jgi:hypothetical protein
MKRDMDLIRMLLLQQEDGKKPPGLDEYPGEVQAYHAGLLIDAGLVEGQTAPGGQGEIIGAVITRLTWAGHDFLDAARSDTVWNKAKEKVLKPGLSWTLSALVEFLKAEAHAQMQRHGLLPPMV